MTPRRPTPCGNALEARVGGVFIAAFRFASGERLQPTWDQKF